MIIELLESKKLLPEFPVFRTVQAVVYAMEDKYYQQALSCASLLREEGISTEVIFGARKPKWAFERADKLKAGTIIMYHL